MPMLIDHINEIAKRTNRPALFLTFQTIPRKNIGDAKAEITDIDSLLGIVDWIAHPSRKEIVRWLDHQEIRWQYCAGSPDNPIELGYQGQIYIDVIYYPERPLQEQPEKFKRLIQFLEDGNGNVRWAGVKFYCLLNKD